MRGRNAKALRKLARQSSIEMPERRLLQKPRPKSGAWSTVINDPKSTRGVYRFLKKVFEREPSAFIKNVGDNHVKTKNYIA